MQGSSKEWTAGKRMLGGSLAPWRNIFRKGLEMKRLGIGQIPRTRTWDVNGIK